MKLYFDIDIITGPMYGMTYATFSLMKAFASQGHQVINFASGRPKNLIKHRNTVKQFDLDITVCPIPKKLLALFHTLNVGIDTAHLKNYDFFFQIGVHTKRIIPRKKYILSIHDTVGMRYPEGECIFPKNTSAILKRATKIITVSHFSKKEIERFFQVPSDKIEVIYNGCDHNRFHPYKKKDKDAITKKYDLPKQYLVAYGGKSPRKNIPFLIKGYSQLSVDNKPKLVIFGQEVSSDNPDIISLGYLPENDVPVVLSAAKALIVPSFYEGFGLPIIEAFACGVPVICSNATSLPEVSQGNAILFDPFDQNEFQKKLIAFLSNEKMQNKMIDKGLEIAQTFTWEKSAKQLISVLESLK